MIQIPETLEETRDRLLRDSKKEKEQDHSGYVNGVLDFYNSSKQLQEKLNE